MTIGPGATMRHTVDAENLPSRATHPFEWVAAGLFVLLVAFWLTVTARTLQAIRSGAAWRR